MNSFAMANTQTVFGITVIKLFYLIQEICIIYFINGSE